MKNKINIPEFTNYEEEAEFWDNLDTADLITDDWFRFKTPIDGVNSVIIQSELETPEK